MAAEEHRHQPRVLAELEALDLKVMFRNADARPARLVARARVLGDLVEHPLVQHRILAGHAALQLVAPADRDVHERVEIHGPLIYEPRTLHVGIPPVVRHVQYTVEYSPVNPRSPLPSSHRLIPSLDAAFPVR